MNCTVCGVELPIGRWASCEDEQRCLTHCTDFAHVTPAEEPEESWEDDGDRRYDAAADDAVAAAIEAGEPENWRAYMRNGG